MNSKSTWKIRNASVADIELIRSLCQRIWPATYSHMLSAEQLDYMMEWMYSPSSLQAQMADGAQFLLLYYRKPETIELKSTDSDEEETAQPVGYASYQSIGNNHYKLHKLYILPTLQGLGGGRYLMDQIILKVRGAGGHSIELQVNRSNTAVDFYKQLGFQIIKEADFPIGNGYYMNDYIMQISLKQ